MSDTHPDQARRYESGPPRTARRSHGSTDVLAVRTSARVGSPPDRPRCRLCSNRSLAPAPEHRFERRDDRCCRGTSKRRVALTSHRQNSHGGASRC
ncbi:hypothetical protein DICSQDRAFT_135655 [Dichomitus squalens LYAD-421 SS1]|uniref:uncharacterized protein n=1 Tax=Dichomitus squalens (strain LYAD-421) TaxID=732165 RepID=UPI0004412904|nr:uncharacterized protein DICSQDRAFT_135655 [Dichomitus squalens LYAD-421 SS1]EJF62678.1 hypothetical protein DICSQDRAFT_135655 [Dichomitus squalens LYAD-421 SS1]